uniref:VWFA domain-containing protein n=1 Tax=Strongyloides stercoralis TaxID=6248 RepID=A0AAF5I2G8_STRER
FFYKHNMILFTFLYIICFSIPWINSTSDIVDEKTLNNYIRMLYPSSCTYVEPSSIEDYCDTDIIFAIDASNEALFPLLFDMEISVIKNSLATNSLDYKKVALSWYNKNVTTIPFGTFNIKNDFDNTLSNISLNDGSSLSKLLSDLNTLQSTNFDSISTYIFISYISPEEIINSIENAGNLKMKGSLNFIILGNVVTRDDLELLNPSNIFYWDFSSQCITNMVSFFNKTLDCSKKSSYKTTQTITNTTTPIETTPVATTPIETTSIKTTPVATTPIEITSIKTTSNLLTTASVPQTHETSTTTKFISSTTTTILTTTTTTPIKPSGKCQDNIVIAIDASTNFLSDIQFEYQKNLVKYNITKNYQNFKLLSIAGYSNNVSEFFPYGTIIDRPTLIKDVDSITRGSGSSLSTLMEKLITPGNLQSTFIFLSFTTDDEIKNSINYSKILKNKGTLNFIILGNSLTQSLQPLNPSNTYNFFFLDSKVPSLLSWFNSSMACNNYNIPTTSTYESKSTTFSTLNTILSTLTTSTLPLTTSKTVPSSILTTISPVVTTSNSVSSTNVPSTVVTSTIVPSTIVTSTVVPSTVVTSTNVPSTIVTSTIVPSTVVTSTNVPSTVVTSTIVLSTVVTSTNVPSTVVTSTVVSSITTKNAPSTTTSCINGHPEKVCDGQIIVSLDASNNLNKAQFDEEINVFKDNISIGWKNLEKIALSWYNSQSISFTFRTITNRKELETDLSVVSQGPGLNLTNCLKKLTQLKLPIKMLSTFVFLSTTTDDDINNSIQYANELQSKGTLNFIVLKSSNSQINLGKLKNFNTFYWDFSNDNITDLVNFFNSSMACETRCINTTEIPSTITTNIYESTSITTTTSALPITPQCNNSVFFVIDQRSSISQDLFNNQILKIKDVTNAWDVTNNYASIDINSKYETGIFLNFPIQPKDDLTLYSTSLEWNCIIAYLEKNSNDLITYCGKDASTNFYSLRNSNQPMDGFLNKFYDRLNNDPLDVKNFTTVLLIQTDSQDEVNNLVDVKNSIISINYNIKIVIVNIYLLNITVSKLNNINSHISSNCFTQNNEIKNTIPYSDCNTDVTLAVDSSTDSLLPILFSDYEEGLIKNNITSNWTDFSNVNLVWYSENPNVHMTIGTMETRSNFEFILSLIKQSSGSNLDKLIEKLLNIPQTSGNNVSTFIFIAQYYKNNMENTYKNIQLLKQKGDPLIKSTQCLFEQKNTNCFIGDPTQNCNTDIIISVDASSNALLPILFQMEINLIKDNITSNWSNFNKVALTWYNEKPYINYNFGSIKNKSQFDQILSSIELSDGSKLSLLLSALNSNIISKDDLKPLNPSNVFYWTFADYCINQLLDFVSNSLSCNNSCTSTSTLTPILSTEKLTSTPSIDKVSSIAPSSTTLLPTTSKFLPTTATSLKTSLSSGVTSTFTTFSPPLTSSSLSTISVFASTTVTPTGSASSRNTPSTSTKLSFISTNSVFASTTVSPTVNPSSKNTPSGSTKLSFLSTNSVFASTTVSPTVNPSSKNTPFGSTKLSSLSTNSVFASTTVSPTGTASSKNTPFGSTKLSSLSTNSVFASTTVSPTVNPSSKNTPSDSTKLSSLSTNSVFASTTVSPTGTASSKNIPSGSTKLSSISTNSVFASTTVSPTVNPSSKNTPSGSTKLSSLSTNSVFASTTVSPTVNPSSRNIPSGSTKLSSSTNSVFASTTVSPTGTASSKNIPSGSTKLSSISTNSVFASTTVSPTVNPSSKNTPSGSTKLSSLSTNSVFASTTVSPTVNPSSRSIPSGSTKLSSLSTNSVFASTTVSPTVNPSSKNTPFGSTKLSSLSTNSVFSSTTVFPITTVSSKNSPFTSTVSSSTITSLNNISSKQSTSIISSSTIPISQSTLSSYSTSSLLNSVTTTESSSISTTSPLPIKPRCNNIDQKNSISQDLFNKQILKIKDITNAWDVTSNHASIDINSKYETQTFLNFPIQPKNDLILYTTLLEWKCIVAYLEKNSNDFLTYCNASDSIALNYSYNSSNQTMDIFIDQFYNRFLIELKRLSIIENSLKTFSLVIFIEAENESKIDNSIKTLNIMKTSGDMVNFVFITLPNSFPGTYNNVNKYDFSDPNLKEKVTNDIC